MARSLKIEVEILARLDSERYVSSSNRRYFFTEMTLSTTAAPDVFVFSCTMDPV